MPADDRPIPRHEIVLVNPETGTPRREPVPMSTAASHKTGSASCTAVDGHDNGLHDLPILREVAGYPSSALRL